MPGGRPTRLIAKITVDGERTTVHDAIVAQVRRGRTPTTAGKLYRVLAESVWEWIKWGRLAQERLDEGKKITAGERLYLRFVQDLDRAYAEYVREYEDLLDQLAQGGLVVGTIVETVDPTQVDPREAEAAEREGRAPRPLVIERRVTTSRTLPDFRAIKLALERKARHEGWAPQLQQAVDDADGELDDRREEREAELLAAIANFKARLETGEAMERERGAIESTAREADVPALPEPVSPG